MLIPEKLKPYFAIKNTRTSNNTIICGEITCCSLSKFDVLYYGDLKKGLFGHSTLCENEHGLIIFLRCKQCGKIIELFSSFTDGYNRCVCEIKPFKVDYLRKLTCGSKTHSDFTVDVVFEYLPENELIEENINMLNNAFSWIWITLKCNNCKKVFRNIVDYETS